MQVKCERCGRDMDVPMEAVPMCGIVCDQCEAREKELKNQPSLHADESALVQA